MQGMQSAANEFVNSQIFFGCKSSIAGHTEFMNIPDSPILLIVSANNGVCAGKTLQGQELINFQDLQASVSEEQSVFVAAATQLGCLSYRKELTTCRPEIWAQLEVCQARRTEQPFFISQ